MRAWRVGEESEVWWLCLVVRVVGFVTKMEGG